MTLKISYGKEKSRENSPYFIHHKANINPFLMGVRRKEHK
jgi:hypothetical protein